jgi:hypothetical protein
MFRLIRKTRLVVFVLIGGIMSMGVYVQSPTTISVPRNIWLCDTLLLVSDRDNGLMVFSVSNPSSAKHMANIPINRNSGLAASGNTIFANSGDSIVAYCLGSDGATKRLGGIKLYSYYPEPFYYKTDAPLFVCTPLPTPYGEGRQVAPLLPFLACSNNSNGVAANASSVNTGGSMAVFAVIDTFLYYVDKNALYTVSIADPATMTQLSQVTIGRTVETIFPTSKYLFIGGSEGMYMYDRSQPSTPEFEGMVSHIRSCDPVVVQGAVAYVTLRSGNTCGGSSDVLMSVDISDPADAKILKEITTTTPYGLAVDDSLLYVANGWSGYSLYNVKNPLDIKLVLQWNQPTTKDFIWNQKKLYIMEMEQVEIYDVSDPAVPQKLGTIE